MSGDFDLDSILRLAYGEPDDAGAGESPDPSAAAARFEASGRYRVKRELGRGGNGVVLEVHDSRLGRDVAVKIVPVASAEEARRAVDEACIGGRLQHPSIVPVHDVGVLGGDLVFFTMKAVRGETLSARLRRRDRPGDDVAALVAVLSRVAEAVACAHDQGIVHRDIKPANVMIGDFGEVQLMDWGLAKPISPDDPAAPDRARTAAGIIMGTPAYAAPEQARGDVDAIDARTDVFALGGILCEILTGRSPFDVSRTSNAWSPAAEADLADAWRRLDGCGADAELVQCARCCLAPRPGDRPADASAVLDMLSRWELGRGERLRRSELEAAAAAARARHEATLRRRTLWMSCLVVAVILAGGAGWRELDARRSRRLENARVDIAALLARCTSSIEAARRPGADDLDAWDAASRAAAAAKRVARSAGVALDASDLELCARAVEGRRRAAADRERRHRDDVARRRFFDLRVRDGRTKGVLQLDAAYKRILIDWGVDLASASGTAMAEHVTSSSIRADALDALDEWLRMLHRAGAPRERWKNLANLVDRVDDDPLRREIRELGLEGEREELAELLDGVDVPSLSRGAAVTLGWAVANLSGSEAAVRVLREAQRAHPGDYQLCYLLGFHLTECDPPRFREALGFYRAALAADDGDPAVRLDIGVVLAKLGRLDEGRSYWRPVVDEYPRFGAAWRKWARMHATAGRAEVAHAVMAEALRRLPDDVACLRLAAGVAVLAADPAVARRHLEHLIALVPGDADARRRLDALE